MSAEPEPLRVSLEVWHPDCWTIETTEAVDVGILGRVVARDVGSRSTAFVTLYADRRRELDDAIETIRSSPHVHDATRVPRTGPGSDHARPGNATTDLLIDHEASSQISGAFLSRDFVHARPVDTRDGSEQWVLLTKQTRDGVTESLDEITDAQDADITVTGISRTADDTNAARFSLTSLSARQRRSSNSPAPGATTSGRNRFRRATSRPNSTSRRPRCTNTSTRRRRSCWERSSPRPRLLTLVERTRRPRS
ncbi:bacterio-opsin activator [Haloarculaceae archaeon H-GB11]|nr:bacterio-opsin activator [Haloarculaceae archaeon H-GB11]